MIDRECSTPVHTTLKCICAFVHSWIALVCIVMSLHYTAPLECFRVYSGRIALEWYYSIYITQVYSGICIIQVVFLVSSGLVYYNTLHDTIHLRVYQSGDVVCTSLECTWVHTSLEPMSDLSPYCSVSTHQDTTLLKWYSVHTSVECTEQNYLHHCNHYSVHLSLYTLECIHSVVAKDINIIQG